jgi:hypothetical protein
VMGGRCIEHERGPTRVFVRGRPFVAGGDATAPDVVASVASTGGVVPTLDLRSDSYHGLEPSPN